MTCTTTISGLIFLSAFLSNPVARAEDTGSDGGNEQVSGAWESTVHIEQPPEFEATFPAMYAFAEGGAFSRVDGRNNGPSLGTWNRTEEGIVFQFIVYQFSGDERIRTVIALARAEIKGDTMSGTFTASAPDGFFRAGSFTATRVPARGP